MFSRFSRPSGMNPFHSQPSPEPPVTFQKEPQDLCLPEGSLASIECELSRQNASVRWLKVREYPPAPRKQFILSRSMIQFKVTPWLDITHLKS